MFEMKQRYQPIVISHRYLEINNLLKNGDGFWSLLPQIPGPHKKYSLLHVYGKEG